ncbi:hypothetical protein HYH02_006088 [Chlamydomonas schloesseri]|uniref:Uncharacterized protein n=1 Tax=Chlamydomonas schloesseri TaxID=2026947 RepID=A0A836B6D2_9CHLO|nr:hypothetical protein HYH02_006088 [Chlamydomonas schloesseri]|eukprot:KAG2448733.1 hypothetical protein HYH02_006088 [Chlamydomonas schloesseri]
MVSRTRAAEALGAATSDERGKLLFFLHKVSDEELSGWDIEGQDNDTILSFIREAYKHAQGGSLPAAAASAPGLGSAEGAGTASAANQGAVPLLGRGGPAADAPTPRLKDRFLGLGVAFVHVMCAGVVLALLAQWVINNNAANVLFSTYASMSMNIYSVVYLMVPPLKQAWFQPNSTLSAYAKVFEGVRKSLQNWQSESASLLAAPIIFVLVGCGLAIMYCVSLSR